MRIWLIVFYRKAPKIHVMGIILVRGYCKQADADFKVSLQSHLFEIYWDESACYVSRKAMVGTVLRQWH